MSKLSEKKKIEEIAKNLLKKQKSYKNINTVTDKNRNKITNEFSAINKDKNNINNGEDTLKDNLYFTKSKNEKIISNKEIKQVNKNGTIFNKYSKNEKENRPNENLKFYSSTNNSLTDYYYCCKKNTEDQKNQIEYRNNNQNIDNNINNNQINDNYNNQQEKKLQNKSNEEYKDKDVDNLSFFLLEYNSNNSIIDENNLDNFNKIMMIYKELMNDFGNTNFKAKKDHFRSQILSCEFFKFLFSDNILLFLKYFNFSIDVNKFILYQIMIFLTLVYLDENKDLNESTEMSYRTILLYSSQNYELLLNIIKKLVVPSEPKVYKSLISKNKIIVSILKTILPRHIKKSYHTNKNIISNNIEANPFIEKNLIYFNLFEEIETETKLNRTNELKKSINNKIIKLLTNLKKDEKLINKINQIEKKAELENVLIDNNIKDNLSNNQNKEKNKCVLPEFDKDKYKYSLFIDLDETLVHYYEKGTSYFVKVRGGTDDFIKTMSEFCEIIIVSSSGKEYTDIIVNNFNKDKCYVNYTIYKESFDEDNNNPLDLSTINRDLKKCIFICHTDEFFNAPKNNILKLSEFLGEENDKEIVYLYTELIKLSVNNVEDVTTIIKDILRFIQDKKNEEIRNK